ncbi:MAG TPA: preprotein translocase subunit SecG [Tissierellaceae bacterium]|nr:preprotein translocase subunit SecG [Tissierellaceae bacterium]
MQTLFSILVLASALTVIISVLLQEGEEGGGLGAISGNASDSLFGMNRGKSKQVILQRITAISAAIFIVSTLVLAAK